MCCPECGSRAAVAKVFKCRRLHCLFFKLGRDAQLKRDEYQSLADVFLRAVFSHDYRRIVADKVQQYNCNSTTAAPTGPH